MDFQHVSKISCIRFQSCLEMQSNLKHSDFCCSLSLLLDKKIENKGAKAGIEVQLPHLSPRREPFLQGKIVPKFQAQASPAVAPLQATAPLPLLHRSSRTRQAPQRLGYDGSQKHEYWSIPVQCSPVQSKLSFLPSIILSGSQRLSRPVLPMIMTH